MRISDGSSDVCSSDLMDWSRDSLNEMERCGLTRDVPSILARITVSDSLEDAVAEADYVQESVFERVDVKQRISLAIGAAIRADANVGRSRYGIPASEVTRDVQRRDRLIIWHTVNPTHT